MCPMCLAQRCDLVLGLGSRSQEPSDHTATVAKPPASTDLCSFLSSLSDNFLKDKGVILLTQLLPRLGPLKSLK